MSNSSSTDILTDAKTIPKLTNENGGKWFEEFDNLSKLRGLRDYFAGYAEEPDVADPDRPTKAERTELRTYRRERDQASGLLWHCIDESQRAHIAGSALKDDPHAAYKKLLSIHRAKRPSSRFAAYDRLLSICMNEGETLTDLMARTRKAALDARELRPTAEDDKDGNPVPVFTLDHLDAELEMHALFKALPAEYNNFLSSLLLLDPLTIDNVRIAFQNEDTNRKSQMEKAAAAAALSADHSVAPHRQPAIRPSISPPSSSSSSSSPSSSSSSQRSSSLTCYWCNRSGHIESECRTKAKARQTAQSRTASRQAAANTTSEETATQEQPAT